jgi:hypothetical protein
MRLEGTGGNAIIAALNAVYETTSTQTPYNYDKMCGNPSSKAVEGNMTLTTFAGLDSVLRGWKFPDSVSAFARNIRFSSATRL